MSIRNISKGDVFRKYCFDEMGRKWDKSNSGIKKLEKYVDCLGDNEAEKLCRRLSHSRHNRVFRFISEGPDKWMVKKVKIDKIYMGGINSKINEYFRRNHWLLEEIVKDRNIRKIKELKLKSRDDGRDDSICDRSRSLLARKHGGYYKIIDGNHRIVKLAVWNKKKEFELVFY